MNIKKNSKYISLLNIIFVIAILISRNQVNINFIKIYQSFGKMQDILCIILAVLNILNAVYCLRKSEKKGAILQFILGILIIAIFKFYMMGYIGIICIILLSIINCVYFIKKEDVSKSVLPIIVTGIMLLLLLIATVTPSIFFHINLNRLKKVLPDLSQAECEWSNIQFDGEQYIFKNKKAKELNIVDKNEYGEIRIWQQDNYQVYYGVNIKLNSNDKLILLGYTDKGYVLNYKGEALFKLLYDFEEDKYSCMSMFMMGAGLYLEEIEHSPYGFTVTLEGMKKF